MKNVDLFSDHFFTGNCMSEFMGLILGRYEAKVGIFYNSFSNSFN